MGYGRYMFKHIEEYDEIEVNGKTLKEWALTDPRRLESMFECESDELTRKIMVSVYVKHYLSREDRV